MVALNVQCSMFNGESSLQLPAWWIVVTTARARLGVVIVGHGVLVGLCLGSPRKRCTLHGSRDVVTGLVVHLRLHVGQLEVVGVLVPLAIDGGVERSDNTEVRSALPLATEGTQERCPLGLRRFPD